MAISDHPSSSVSVLSAHVHMNERNDDVSSPPFFRSGVLNYYVPYVLVTFLSALYFAGAQIPEYWWLIGAVQVVIVGVVYTVFLRREEVRRMRLPALVLCMLGALHFFVLNGAFARIMNAIVVSCAIAAHLRGILREYVLPHQSLTRYRLHISLFFTSLSLFMAMAVAGAAVSLLQFSLFGAAGIVFLTAWLMVGEVMKCTVLVPRVQARVKWVYAVLVGELAIIFLFLPTHPSVSAAIMLLLFSACMEAVKDPYEMPSRRVWAWTGCGIVVLSALVFATARWV